MAWFFLRFPGCSSREAVGSVCSALSSVAKISESGVGTVVDPTAGWCVARMAVSGVPEVRERLTTCGLKESPDLIEPLRRAVDGRAMVRQLALF